MTTTSTCVRFPINVEKVIDGTVISEATAVFTFDSTTQTLRSKS